MEAAAIKKAQTAVSDRCSDRTPINRTLAPIGLRSIGQKLRSIGQNLQSIENFSSNLENPLDIFPINRTVFRSIGRGPSDQSDSVPINRNIFQRLHWIDFRSIGLVSDQSDRSPIHWTFFRSIGDARICPFFDRWKKIYLRWGIRF